MFGMNWLHSRLSGSHLSRSDLADRAGLSAAANQLMRRRLGAEDPYWWILAGGIYVPGFDIDGPGKTRPPMPTTPGGITITGGAQAAMNPRTYAAGGNATSNRINQLPSAPAQLRLLSDNPISKA
jgi:hypothetical protein